MCQPLLRQVQLRQVHVLRHVLHYTIQLRTVLVHYYIHVLLYTTTYISYESSNQGLFPLRKMVVIRLVLEDCTRVPDSNLYRLAGNDWPETRSASLVSQSRVSMSNTVLVTGTDS